MLIQVQKTLKTKWRSLKEKINAILQKTLIFFISSI